jgi:putative hemolysin
MTKQPPSPIPYIRYASSVLWAATFGLLFALTGCVEMNAAGADRGRLAEAGGPAGKVMIANPASVNCIERGGILTIRKRGDGGEYGICTFADGRQCEEWALMRGECPAGGVRVTGLVTPEARYCVLTGGSYTADRKGNTQREAGSCTFPDGRSCAAGAYYEGKCPRYP